MSNRRHVQSAGLIFWQDQQCALLASNSHGSQKSIPIHKTGIKTLIEKSIFKTAQRYVSKQTKHLATYACNYYNIFAYIIYVYAHFFFPINVFHNHIFFSNHLKTVKQQMFERSNVKKLRTHWKQHNSPHSRVCPANGLKQNYYAKYIREWHPIAYVDENMDKHHGKIGIP